ncbi:MAG TPA: VWA domain-containing protein [Acidobacteriota bacterium]|nr:VWA domain-containing protein [Acidobacteriota bacterium]
MKAREHAIRFFGLVLALTVTGLPVASAVAVAGASWNAASIEMLTQEALPAQTPMFRSAVRRVRVDAIVADKDGNFIHDLKADDFRVFEDRVEQEILNVQLVSLTTGQATNMTADDETVTGPAESLAVPAESTPVRRSPASLGAVVYLVDLPSLDRRNNPRLTKTLGSFFEGEGDLEVPRSVFLIDNTGTVQEMAPLTTDREVLRNAAASVAAAGLTSTSIFGRMEQEYEPVMQLAIDAANSPGAVRRGALTPVMVLQLLDNLERKARFDGERERRRAEQTLRTLLHFINALSAMEGRTALVWISSGAMITEGGPYSAFATAVREAVDAPTGTATVERSALSQRVLDLMDEVHETANTGNVSIYTVDPRPISELNNLSTSAAVGTGAVSKALRSHVRPAYRDLTVPLVDLAAKTGGRSFIGWSDLHRAFEEQYNDSTQFYLIFYEPPAPHEDGEYHEIEVQVSYPGSEVRARSGYRELPDSELRDRKVAAALTLPGSVMGRPVPAAAFHRFEPDGAPKILLVVGLPRPAETIAGSWAPAFEGVDPAADNREELVDALGIPYFRVHAIAVDRAGEISGETHATVLPHTDLAGYAPVAPFQHIRYTTEWSVEPGTHDIRLLIAEDGGDRFGTSRLQVQVPSSDGWTMADPMLGVLEADAAFRPLLDQGVSAGNQIFASVQVSGATDPYASALIFQGATRDTIAWVPLLPLRPEGPGVYGGLLRLPYLDPGEYLVELQVVDTTPDGQAARLLPLRVVEGD